MGAIMIRCPKTDELIPVGIDTDRDTFAGLPDVAAQPVRCPACGGAARMVEEGRRARNDNAHPLEIERAPTATRD